jgi:hypothetical protein
LVIAIYVVTSTKIVSGMFEGVISHPYAQTHFREDITQMSLKEVNIQKLDESQDSWCCHHQGSADLATQVSSVE